MLKVFLFFFFTSSPLKVGNRFSQNYSLCASQHSVETCKSQFFTTLSTFSRTPCTFDRKNNLLHFTMTSRSLLLEQQLQQLSYYCRLCTFLHRYIYLTSLALTAICLVNSGGGRGGGEDSANCSPVNWTRTNGAMMGHESGWWGCEGKEGRVGERNGKRYFSLIKILFRWINPFLMCVFSEARLWKKKSSSLSAPAALPSYLFHSFSSFSQLLAPRVSHALCSDDYYLITH